MSKFKMRVKLTGFEFEIEGTREDAKLIAQSVGDQISSTLLPALNVIDGEATTATVQPPAVASLPAKKAAKRRSRTSSTAASSSGEDALSLKPAPATYGNPQQHWSSLDKAMWLIYVMHQEMAVDGLTQSEIVATFKRHFRESKPIYAPTLGRVLLSAKTQGLVAEDSDHQPSKWHLLDNGIQYVKDVIQSTLVVA